MTRTLLCVIDDRATADHAAATPAQVAALVAEFEALAGPLHAAWDSSPALVIVLWGPQQLLVYQNEASSRVAGRRPLGQSMREAFPEANADTLQGLADARDAGKTTVIPRRPVGVIHADGLNLLMHFVVAPIGQGPPYVGAAITAIDVTAEARAEQAAERAHLLTQVAERMNAATDPDAALKALTKALVPALADAAAVYVYGPAKTAAPVADANEPVAMTVSAELLVAAGPPPPPTARQGPAPWDSALREGRMVLIELDDVVAEAAVRGDGASWLRSAGAHNVAVIPLIVAGQMTGAVVLTSAGTRSRYRTADTAFLEDVAARAGAAVSHVRIYQHQRQTALTLQRALLPSAPPPMPGMQVAARYVAGSQDVEVGGDWWDVHHLGGGCVGIGVGDVSGRGVPAAVLMGQARAGMRTASYANLNPVRVLTVLDRQVTDLVAPTQSTDYRLPAKFATAAYAVIDPIGQTLRVANAGHPPLVVRYPCGQIELVQAPPGPPLGLGVGGYEELSVRFPPGSLLAAFTDGLIESRTKDIDTGIAAVVAAIVASDQLVDLDELADALLSLADATDDTALILLRMDS